MHFLLKQAICYPGFGVKANEDAVGYGKDYCFAMDGASSLTGKHILGDVSDAAWMSQRVKQELCALLDSGDDRPTRELLLQVMGGIRREYVSILQEKGIEAPEDSPSAGFAMFRQRHGRLEFFGLGDCVGMTTQPDGSFFSSLEENLPNLDGKVLAKMLELHKTTGMTMKEAGAHCKDMLILHRNLRNKPGGYWILDLLTDDGIYNATEKTWELTKPVAVAAVSDGFAQLTEVFGTYRDYEDLYEAMQKTDLEEMFLKLCAMQDADPDLNDYPRFKHRDDTSALWGIFTP